jgi:hypothetical protein
LFFPVTPPTAFYRLFNSLESLKKIQEPEMFRKVVCALVFAVLTTACVLPSFAWDETGHKITAYIAWQQMTPEARSRVTKLLLAAPEDAQLSTFYMGYGSQSEEARKRDFFVAASTWPDIIKDKNFDARYKKYNHSNWHYFDTLWMVKDGKVEFLKAPDDAGHLMEKLSDFDKLLRGTASDAEKSIAVAWMEHLIGDLHQPLHTTARADGPDDKGDQGGNLFALTPKGAPSDKSDNLHRFWDSVIMRNMPNATDTCDTAFMIPIAESIMKQFSYSKLQPKLAPGKYEEWEKESIEIATKDVYKGVKRYEPPSDEYRKKALAIAEERLALAGYRMGELFNEIFGAPK